MSLIRANNKTFTVSQAQIEQFIAGDLGTVVSKCTFDWQIQPGSGSADPRENPYPTFLGVTVTIKE